MPNHWNDEYDSQPPDIQDDSYNEGVPDNYEIGDWKYDDWDQTGASNYKWGDYLGKYPGADERFRQAELNAFTLRAIADDLRRIKFDWSKLRGAVSDDYIGSLEQERLNILADLDRGELFEGGGQVDFSHLNTTAARSHLGGWKSMGSAVDQLMGKWYSNYDPGFEYYHLLGVGESPDFESYKPSMTMDGYDLMADAAIDS